MKAQAAATTMEQEISAIEQSERSPSPEPPIAGPSQSSAIAEPMNVSRDDGEESDDIVNSWVTGKGNKPSVLVPESGSEENEIQEIVKPSVPEAPKSVGKKPARRAIAMMTPGGGKQAKPKVKEQVVKGDMAEDLERFGTQIVGRATVSSGSPSLRLIG